MAKSRIGPDGEGSGGEEVSQAYFVIKAAQIREELQRKGDELDSKIRIVEREMSALDSTLRHVVGANSKFRSGFQAADMNSKEGKKMMTMKKRVKASDNILFKKRKEVQRLTNDVEDVKVRLQNTNDEIANLKAQREQLTDAREEVMRSLDREKSANDSLIVELRKLSQQHRRQRGVPLDQETKEERSMRAHAMNSVDDNILFTLSELANEFPEMKSGCSIIF